MTTLKLAGHIDDQHQLHADVPSSIAPGPVEVLVLVPTADEDDAGTAWLAGIAEEWKAELSDPREDVYTLSDGEPVREPR